MLIRDRLLRRSWLTIPLTILAVAALMLPCSAGAGTTAPKWHFQWRPNWIPGDPAGEPAALLFAPETVLRSGFPIAAPGLLIALDPVTRQPVMPTPEQRKAFAADAARAAAHDAPLAPGAYLRVEQLPGGGELVHLDGRFQVYSIARRDANGRITTDCAPDLEAAKTALSQPAPVQPEREER